MNYLKELAVFISRNKIKQTNTMFPGGTNRKSKIFQLYQGIVDDQIKNDEDIQATFFGDTDYQVTYTNRLKRKLRDRLMNTVFLIDLNQPQYTDFQKAYITCQKNLAAIQILGSQYVQKSAIEIAKNTLRQSRYYGFTEITLSIARYLHLYYGTVLRDQKKMTYYRDLIIEQGKVLQYELKAETYFMELNLALFKKAMADDNYLQHAIDYSDELWPLLGEIKTPKFNIFVFLFTLKYHELRGDFSKMVNISNEAISFYQQNPQIANINTRYVFPLNKIVAHTQLREFHHAETTAIQAMQQVTEGTGPWFSLAHYLMTNYYHSEQFEKAIDLLIQMKAKKNFKKMTGSTREQFRFHEAFLFFFTQTISIDDKNLFGGKFKVQKFLNEVPASSRDKQGANTTIIVLQILVCLVQNRYDDIIKRSDALKTYTSRYLKKDENFRSNCFIKMLLQLPAANFHRNGVERKAQRYQKELLKQPINLFRNGAEHEYMPYEVLWKYVLQNLDLTFHYS